MTAASDHLDVPATVDLTTACEAGDCHRCRGTVLSVTAAHGRPCGHACHRGDDRAIEAALERHHFDDPFDTATGTPEHPAGRALPDPASHSEGLG